MQKRGRELASKLKPGTVIAVQDREAQNYTLPFLIGITQDAGNGSCIVEQVQSSKSIDGTRFTAGDYALAVKWLDRLSEDPEQRTFELNHESVETFVINSTELRMSNLELDKVVPTGAAPRRQLRASTRNSSRVRKEKFMLPIQIEQHILETLY